MRTMWRAAMGGMLMGALLAGVDGAAARATTITLDPPQATIASGGALSLALEAAGLGGTPQAVIGGFDVFLSWDPAVLQFDAAMLGSALGSIPAEAVTIVSPALASVELFETSLLDPAALAALQNGTVVLATLSWTVLDARDSQVAVSGLVSDALGGELPVEFGSADLPAVPEPKAWLLFVLGAALVSTALSGATGSQGAQPPR